MHRLIAALSLVVAVGFAAPASAKKMMAPTTPSVDEVKAFVQPLTPVPTEPVAAAAKDAAVAKLGAPFTYDGFTYIGTDAAANKKCKKTWAKAGTVKAAKLAAFFDCMINANYLAPMQAEADWAVADLAKLPAPFKKHKAKLAKLATDHTLVVSHFLEEGEGTFDNWNLYAVRKEADGSLKLDVLLTGSAKKK
jgi:hypothetical protein